MQQHLKAGSTDVGAGSTVSTGKPGSEASLDRRGSSSVSKAFEVAASPAGPLVPSSEQAGSGQPAGSGLANFKYDPARAARFMLFSVLLATPVAHQWFALLDKVRRI